VGASKMKTKKKPLKKTEKEKEEKESRQVKKIRMLDDISNDLLASFKKCTLDKVISIFQNYVCDPSIVTNQEGLALLLLTMLSKKSLTCIIRSPWSHPSLRMYVNQGFMSL
jgi:hypothetical protein